MLGMAEELFDLVLAGKIVSEPSLVSLSKMPQKPIADWNSGRPPARQFLCLRADHCRPVSRWSSWRARISGGSRLYERNRTLDCAPSAALLFCAAGTVLRWISTAAGRI